MRNAHYRHRFGIKVRISAAASLWVIVNILMAMFGGNPFLGSLVQAVLIAGIVFAGLALYPLVPRDREEVNVFANRCDGIFRLLFTLADILFVLYGILTGVTYMLYH